MAQQRDVVLEPPVEPGGVIVGFDGSAAAMVAVRAAADEAARRGVDLHVVRAWTLSTAMDEVGAPVGTVPSVAEVAAAVRASVDRAVAAVEGTHPGVRIVGHVHHGKAVQALVEASRNAQVMVVSRRGQGGFVDLLLGGTADQVVRYAQSSVLVVRSEAPSPG